MLPVYAGSAVRRAEAASVAAAALSTDPDRFMKAAAHGLAAVVLGWLGRAGLPAPDVSGPLPHRSRVLALRGRGVVGTRVAVLVGPGNNGGDGLYAAAFLARRGADVTAVQVGGRVHARAEAAARLAGVRLRPWAQPLSGEVLPSAAQAAVNRAQVVIDAALGTGAREALPLPPVPEAAWVIACDLASGLDADSGQARGVVLAADTTVTMGAIKTGLLLGEGRALSGDVWVVPLPGLLDVGDLGEAEFEIMGAAEARAHVLAPRAAEHKYSRGVLGLVAGSPSYPGAAVLCAQAALATGVGMLTAFSRGTARLHLSAAVPEAVVASRDEAPGGALAAKSAAWVVGPGLGEAPEDLAAATRVLAAGAPLVLDASGLLAWGRGTAAASPRGAAILTPHAGELRALGERLGWGLPDPVTTPLEAARAAAKASGAVVLLKGSCTLVASPEGAVLAACSAGPELAVAGSGDTLAGILGALVATHAARATHGLADAELMRLAAAAAVLHGLAASAAPARGALGLSAGLNAVLRPADS